MSLTSDLYSTNYTCRSDKPASFKTSNNVTNSIESFLLPISSTNRLSLDSKERRGVADGLLARLAINLLNILRFFVLVKDEKLAK